MDRNLLQFHRVSSRNWAMNFSFEISIDVVVNEISIAIDFLLIPVYVDATSSLLQLNDCETKHDESIFPKIDAVIEMT